MTATIYRRFNYKHNNARKVVILSNPRDIKFLGTDCVTGIVVNRDGEEISGKTFDREQRIIDKATITSSVELFMSRKYGWLQTGSDTDDKDLVVYDKRKAQS